ncbi:MAG: nucleolar RNA-binding Nop10p family protein [Candidatus Asgardarchaeia archaeon]
MPTYLRRCVVCGNYTLKKRHCGKETIDAHPLKYSPVDRYWLYKLRRFKEWKQLLEK